MAQRFVVNVLECNKPMLDESISEEDERAIMKEYEAILERLYKNAVKNGGDFNRFSAV